MSTNISRLKIPVTIGAAFALLAVTLLTAPVVLAAAHTVALTAEVLPNGQYGYKRGNQAVIPGPTLFVKQGDTVTVALTNNTPVPVGFKVPGLSTSGAKAAAGGGAQSYSFTASKTGTYVYHGDGPELLGLFGALVVDKTDGSVESYVGSNGAIAPVNATQLAKQYVLFMVGSTFWGTEISADGATQTPLWTNPVIGSMENDLIRVHVLSVGPGHTFHLHAHRWLQPGTTNVIDTKLLADGADSHAFTIKAGVGVGPGNWQYHCHLFSHMEAGMHGSFRVDSHTPGPNFGTGSSIVGASPYGAIFGTGGTGPGLVTFVISDQPGSWFRSARDLSSVTVTKSLEVIAPGSSVNFIMADTNTVHTLTSLLWPSGAELHSHTEHASMPFDQTRAYKGGGLVKLTTPGLYVFTCKVHPYMFGAVIVDDPATDGLDLGATINLATGIKNLPTTSHLAAVLLKTFFVATAPSNWQVYSPTGPSIWSAKYPAVPVYVAGVGTVPNLHDYLTSVLHTNDVALAQPIPPAIHGIGEVWVDTQFEKTAHKTKPGTITVIDASNWTIKRKIALPGINMNNPHNMWPSHDQSVVYQTQWFDNKLTKINRSTGALISNIHVGEAPAHVMVNPVTSDIIVSNNGEDGMSIIPAGGNAVSKMMPTQHSGQSATNPHGHWISADGSKIVTPNIFTGDIGIYASGTGDILERTQTGNNAPGAHPIAIGMMPDSSKIYASNLLHHSLSVLDGHDGTLKKTINLIANYNPITGAIGGDGTVGILPIQTPVSPDGKAVVLANTGGMILIIRTSDDTIVKMLPCGPGCHGANFGAKKGGGYYAYVTSKFENNLIVVDVDPNGDGDLSDAMIAGKISLVADNSVPKDDTIASLAGFGGNGVLAIPNVYNGWVQKLPDTWKAQLTDKQKHPF